MKPVFLLSLVAALLTSCSKDPSRVLTFRVHCSNCTAVYGVEGARTSVSVSREWSARVVANEGDAMYLSVCYGDVPSSFSGWIFLDDSNLTDFSLDSQFENGCREVDATVPER